MIVRRTGVTYVFMKSVCCARFFYRKYRVTLKCESNIPTNKMQVMYPKMQVMSFSNAQKCENGIMGNRRRDKCSLTLVVIRQYVVMIVAVMLFLRVTSFFTEMSPDGYHDMFWSVTIPYIICAAVYYIALYFEIRKANRMLQDLKNELTKEN